MKKILKIICIIDAISIIICASLFFLKIANFVELLPIQIAILILGSILCAKKGQDDYGKKDIV